MGIEELRLDRRALLKGAGVLMVTVALPGKALAAVLPGASRPPFVPEQLASWIAVKADGGIIAFFGKTDSAQGVDVGIAQIVAEELDVPVERVEMVLGDTSRTINQGGASGSTGVQRGGIALRNAAAEARRLLLDLAAARLGMPADRLSVADGTVSGGGKSVSYGELIGGRSFETALHWNGKLGNDLVVSGVARPKPVADYKVVGKTYRRPDIAQKVLARFDYVTDVTRPGMLHGRMIRPPVAGALPVAVDENSLRGIPGASVVRKDGFLAVVADHEWNAIRAAEALQVTWSKAAPAFPDQADLYDHIRNAPVRKRAVELEQGTVDQAFAGAARVVAAEYEWPYQSHSSIAPACAICEISDGKATLWSGTAKPHAARDGVAKLLGLPAENVETVWLQGPGAYGRNDAGDAAMDAALLAQLTGRPVRVQGMRHEGHGWDPKGPASIHRARAALDANGQVTAYHFESKGFSRVDVDANESDPRYSLAGQLLGMELKSLDGFGVPADAYGFANKRLAWETIAPPLDRASPLRTSHLRDPVGPQIHFASESFIDELAAATGSDPVAFRLKYLTGERDIAAVKAAAEAAHWVARPSGPKGRISGSVATGRGLAYAQRGDTIVAVVAEVDVELKTGAVRATRFVVAHDCGLIVNPGALKACIEGNIIHGTSRALHEEVNFDRRNVTSIDWLTYPILDIAEAPDSIEIVLIDRPDLPPSGAGEPSSRPVAAAIGNAIFDATGIRIRRAPFTPDRLLAVQA